MRAAGVLAIGAAALAAACSRKPVFTGVGPWHLNKTTLRDATGRCQPTDLPDGRKGTWCFGQPALRVGGQDASIDLYFDGTEPSAKVIEIQLQFRGCREEPLEAWLRTNFGDTYDQRGKRSFRQNAGAFIIGDVPVSPARCMIRLLPRSEAAEVERLRAPAPPAAVPAPSAPALPPPAPPAPP